MEELQYFVMNDIINTIRKNEDVRNISHNDAHNLIELTTKLYMKIYSKYKELEEFTVRLYDQSMELATDKYEKTIDELEEEVMEMKTALQEKDNKLQEQESLIQELQKQLQTLQSK